jgi:hypothetical protein
MKKNQVNNNNGKDLHDSVKDYEAMQEPDETFIDLPDVKDIPGQEHVRPMPSGEMADTTISSSGEEGDYLFASEDNDELENLGEADVTPEEKELLRRSSESMASEEDEDVRRAALDNTDDDGTPLNEKTNLSGDELDVPGSEDDDENEEIGEEDEENNSYSLPDQED